MAIVLPGALVHSMKGKLQGSVFSNTRHGLVIKSNNWSKRGHGFATSQARFIQSAINSQWRDCTPAVKASYEGQAWQYPGGSNLNRQQSRLGASSMIKPY